MELVVLPGGGDPAVNPYREGFDLLRVEAEKRGISEVTIVKYPGHYSRTGDKEVLNQDVAYSRAIEPVLSLENRGERYMLFGRSYGCGVAMRMLLNHELPHLNRIALWGPTPIVGIYNVTVHDKTAIETVKTAKGCFVDYSTYASCAPIEAQLLVYSGKHVAHLGFGGKDVHAKPCFKPFLEEYVGTKPNISYHTKGLEGLDHDALPPTRAYFDFVFGCQDE